MRPWTAIFWPCQYKGLTLPQVLFKNPDWFFNEVETHRFDSKGPIAQEAYDLNWKARHILIPRNERNDLVAEYTRFPSNHSFARLEIVPGSQELPPRSERKDVIDLAYPRQFKNDDKSGFDLLLSDLKFIFFGNSRYRMTREQCEAFFENDHHFLSR